MLNMARKAATVKLFEIIYMATLTLSCDPNNSQQRRNKKGKKKVVD